MFSIFLSFSVSVCFVLLGKLSEFLRAFSNVGKSSQNVLFPGKLWSNGPRNARAQTPTLALSSFLLQLSFQARVLVTSLQKKVSDVTFFKIVITCQSGLPQF